MERFVINNYYILLLIILQLTKLIAEDCSLQNSYDQKEKLGPNSKYVALWYRVGFNYNYANSKDYCEKHGLEIATINSADDLRVIREFHTKGPLLFPKEFWLDGTDAQEEGNWLYQITKQAITFQNFYGLAPTNQGFEFGKSADNILLRWINDSESSTKAIVMHDHQGDEKILDEKGYLCQFPIKSGCYKNSDEEKKNRETPDTIDLLGKAGNNKYYIGGKQKTLEEARSFCQSKSKFLLSLKFSSEQESDELYNLLTKWLKKNDLSRNANGFHLDATDTNLFRGDTVFNKRHYWQWVENIIADQKQDPIINQKKGLKRNFGKCLVVGTLYLDKKVFSLARTSCLLPYFFLCSDNNQNPPTTTTRPHPSTTTSRPHPSTTTSRPHPSTTEGEDSSTTTDNPPTTTEKNDQDDNYYKNYDAYLWEVIVV